MQIGDLMETAIWLDGTETEDQRQAFVQTASEELVNTCAKEGFQCGDITFTYKRPGDDRVPDVPKHIEDKAGSLTEIRLLVGEAEVTGILETKGSLVANLEHKDLQRLRFITRRAAFKDAGRQLSNAECDAIIEEIGPDAAVDALRKHTEVSQFH